MAKYISIEKVSYTLDLSINEINKLINAGKLRCIRTSNGSQRIVLDSIRKYQTSLDKKLPMNNELSVNNELPANEKRLIDVRILARDTLFFDEKSFIFKMVNLTSCTRILNINNLFVNFNSSNKYILIIDEFYLDNFVIQDIFLRLKKLKKLDCVSVIIVLETETADLMRLVLEKYPNFFALSKMTEVGWVSGFIYAMSLK